MKINYTRTFLYAAVVFTCAIVLPPSSTTVKMTGTAPAQAPRPLPPALSPPQTADSVADVPAAPVADVSALPSHVRLRNAAQHPTDEVLVLHGWRPALLRTQIAAVQQIWWSAGTRTVVLLCPYEEDVKAAAALALSTSIDCSSRQDKDGHSSTATAKCSPLKFEVFFVPVKERVALLNGRYFWEALHVFLEQKKANASSVEVEQQSVASVERRRLVVAVDATRAMWCQDLFAGLRTNPTLNLTLLGSEMKRNEFLWKRMAHADIYLSLPKFAYEKPTQAMTRSAGAKRKFAVFSHFVGGEAGALFELVRQVAHGLSRFLPGLAFEPFLTDVSLRHFAKGVALVSPVLNDRRAQCAGVGVNDIVAKHCAPALAKARAAERPWDQPAAVASIFVNFIVCDPQAPSVSADSASPRMASESLGPSDTKRHGCLSPTRTPFPKNATLRVDQLRRPFVVATMSAPQRVLPLWKGFSFRGSSVFTPPKVSHQCPIIDGVFDVVIGMAAGYTPDKLHAFISSFTRHRRKNQTKLVLFIKEEHISLFRERFDEARDDVVVVAVEPLTAGSTLGLCPVVLSRIEIMRNFLLQDVTSSIVSAGCRRLRRVIVMDTRDAAFQRDPFGDAMDSLIAGVADGADKEDFFLIPMERFLLGEEDFLNNFAYRLNRFWILKTFGHSFFHRLAAESITGGVGGAEEDEGVTFPIVCGGLYMGSAAAVLDFFDLFVKSAVALGGCWVNDQGLLIGLAAVGISESSFPHPTYLVNPYTTGFTNEPRGGGEVIWNSDSQIVNCNGVPYAILHQYDRYRTAWAALGGTEGK